MGPFFGIIRIHTRRGSSTVEQSFCKAKVGGANPLLGSESIYNMTNCLVCNKKTKRNSYTYCSNKCQSDEKYRRYIENWKKGLETGSRGITTRNISRHIDRYLREKSKNKCCICGWDTINQFLQKVPLEIDHINGNSEDNAENNLQLICPNCHSLSKNYRNLNRGRGRA